MKYFYIITFDGQIFEIRYTEEKINSAIGAWKNGELLILKELGGGIHGNSISKVLNEDLYESYTFSVKPKMFIRDGTWYDGKERRVIRHETWKQKELNNQTKLSGSQEEEISPERTEELLKKYKPEFIK